MSSDWFKAPDPRCKNEFSFGTPGFGEIPTFRGLPYLVNDSIPADRMMIYNGRGMATLVEYQRRIEEMFKLTSYATDFKPTTTTKRGER